MKIVLPVEDRSIDAKVSAHFGRTQYYLAYDDITREYDIEENTAAKSQGGAGIKAAQTVVDLGADVLITPRLGENAAEVLRAAGVRLYASIEGTAFTNISRMIKGELETLEGIHPGFHGHGEK
ncbi:NifB/NifX family molybdenum-iron cluster-binding protein [Youngiibacter fragilis]|uniref:Dinitrogenase iron-molybdenum cofactor biosynthesis protein n=1 Tax=Youngiibacter fragilis 232.1 TaxID=994573 RepID=V7I7C2_9CLOT|nr:NifB/NifX family molybdenum-iron cluster-binding protein [Youngiibacter fragilis]ETA81171.1 dinitrogenase iron-molybdenum cofactor biosynthesis protein [Youngiibacter fragilis 232.1]